MILMVALAGLFFLSILLIALPGFFHPELEDGLKSAFLPKSRTEMIKGMAAIAIVFSHIAT